MKIKVENSSRDRSTVEQRSTMNARKNPMSKTKALKLHQLFGVLLMIVSAVLWTVYPWAQLLMPIGAIWYAVGRIRAWLSEDKTT